MNIIDASKPGVLDLGELVIFSLGNNAYIVSVPVEHQTWEPHFREAFYKLFPGCTLMVVYRRDGEKPSYAALTESADLRQMVEGIVVETLEKVFAESNRGFSDELRKGME